MSKIGKKPISFKEGVTVTEEDSFIKVEGPKGKLMVKKIPYVSVKIENDKVVFKPLKTFKQARSNFGTIRSLVNNAVLGVCEGFSKTLEINGIGFKAVVEGKDLVLNIGFSHLVRFPIPEGVKIEMEKNLIKISGISKDLVGRTAAGIRKLKKPEPYKGKGIKYVDEVIRRKAGKKVVSGSK